MKKITIYSVAQEEGIKRRPVLARAGNMLISELRRQGREDIVGRTKQLENWGNIKKEFSVASYPTEMREIIVSYLMLSKKLQKAGDDNKSKNSLRRHKRPRIKKAVRCN